MVRVTHIKCYALKSGRIADRVRGVAQPGRALRSGRRGRRFKSSRPDHVCNISIEVVRVRFVSKMFRTLAADSFMADVFSDLIVNL